MRKIIPLLCFSVLLGVGLLSGETVSAKPQLQITNPSQLIEAVNSLRSSYGLAPLVMHSILMQSAQSQADYMAATGIVTHARPNGTYTQQLLTLGFPLAGDLSLGGFRSENILSTYGPLAWDGVPPAWQDAEHMNTMLSGNFTHIGAGISQSGDMYYYAVDTAAVTSTGQQQTTAGTILTSVPAGSNGASGVNQFMVPVTLSTARPDGNVTHKVQYGQSLWSIAIAYGTTIKNIQALNNLGEDSTVYQGQELLVLTGATQAAPAAPPATPTAVSPVEAAPSAAAVVVPTIQVQPSPVPVIISTEEPTDAQPSSSSSSSSRVLVVILIVAAFVGAGMAVWLIRDPG